MYIIGSEEYATTPTSFYRLRLLRRLANDDVGLRHDTGLLFKFYLGLYLLLVDEFNRLVEHVVHFGARCSRCFEVRHVVLIGQTLSLGRVDSVVTLANHNQVLLVAAKNFGDVL